MKKLYAEFWQDKDLCTLPFPLTDELVRQAEERLGFKLPQAYIDLLKIRNGGIPVRNCFPTTTPTSWAEDHIAIDSFRGIGGDDGMDSLDTRWTDEDWGYPVETGVVICDCPSAGHDAVMLDYSLCGRDGEPRVIHVDVETGDAPEITVLAPDFETFMKGLLHEEAFN